MVRPAGKVLPDAVHIGGVALEPSFEGEFFPEKAMHVIDSKLICFDPDSWLDRAGQLDPVLIAAARTRLRAVLLAPGGDVRRS